MKFCTLHPVGKFHNHTSKATLFATSSGEQGGGCWIDHLCLFQLHQCCPLPSVTVVVDRTCYHLLGSKA